MNRKQISLAGGDVALALAIFISGMSGSTAELQAQGTAPSQAAASQPSSSEGFSAERDQQSAARKEGSVEGASSIWLSARGVEGRIKDSIAARNPEAWNILRRELLDLSVPREEAVRIARSYRSNPDPLIRYSACKTLYILGDRSGGETLIQLVRAPEWISISGVDSDLRAWAAMTLAEYRDTHGADAVAELYSATKDRELRKYAVALGARQVVPDIMADMKDRVWKDHLEDLGALGVTEAKPLIAQQFSNPKASIRMRVAAAGAMVRLGEREPYLGFLLDVAGRYAADDPVKGDSDLRLAGTEAMRVCGAARGDEVRRFLEGALESENKQVVETALVQLRVNYPDSATGRQALIKQLQGAPSVSASTVYKLAAMTEDAEIRRLAAERNESLWRRAAIHEKDWDKDVWLRSAGAK